MIPLILDEEIFLVLIILGIMCSPAIIMTLIGFGIRQRHPRAAKVLFILSVVNVIVSLGVCGMTLTEPLSIH